MGDVLTTTLGSGFTLVVQQQMDTGEIMLSALLLAVLAVAVLEFTFKVVYRQ